MKVRVRRHWLGNLGPSLLHLIVTGLARFQSELLSLGILDSWKDNKQQEKVGKRFKVMGSRIEVTEFVFNKKNYCFRTGHTKPESTQGFRKIEIRAGWRMAWHLPQPSALSPRGMVWHSPALCPLVRKRDWCTMLLLQQPRPVGKGRSMKWNLGD